MDKFYRFFADTFPQLFGFVGKAIPALADAAQLVKTIVLIACLALAAFAVAAMVIGCFKIRFFRRLARTLLVIETLGMVGLVLIALNTVKGGDFVADLVKALEIGSPAVFDLIRLPADSPLRQHIDGRMWMGSIGEGYVPLMPLLPMTYRVKGTPGVLYDAMIFVSHAHPTAPQPMN